MVIEILPLADRPVGSRSEPIPPEVAVAGSLIPYSRDDAKARYLGYLASGFSVREALVLSDRSKSWLSEARNDAKFVSLENGIPEIRKELAKEYTELEFFRNFRLVLEKDYRVLWKAINPDRVAVPQLDGTSKVMDVPLSAQDHDYLLKIRSQYTPQQLQIIEAIVSGTGDGFNFARWVSENPDIVQISRTDTVVVQKNS